MTEQSWITIYKYYDIFEGQELENLLKENKIPVINQSREDTAYKKTFKASMGEGTIQVKKGFLDQAQKLVKEFSKHNELIAEKSKAERQEFHNEIKKANEEKNKKITFIATIISVIFWLAFAYLVLSSR